MKRLLVFQLVFASTLFGAFISPLFADQQSDTTESDVLMPQKGHLLFGTLQHASDTQVTFVTDSDATVTLSWDKIKEVRTRRRMIILAKKPLSPKSSDNSLSLDSMTIQSAQGILTISSRGQNVTVPQANLISISPPNTPPSSSEAWTISIAPKASLATGTQTQQTLGAQITVRREHEPYRTDWRHQTSTLILDANNSLTKQVGTASIRTHEYDGTLSHTVYLWRGFYANLLAEGYHNSSLNLYLEQSYGGGLGRRVFKNDRNSLELTADFLFIGEHFYGSIPSLGFAAASLTERYTIKLTDLKGGPVYLFESARYTPPFNQPNAWQIRGTAGLVIPVNPSLSMNLSFFDNYLENAPNARKNYSTSSFGLTYTFPPPK